jgi:Kelch motif
MLLLTDGTLLGITPIKPSGCASSPIPSRDMRMAGWGTVSTMALPRGFFASGVLRNGQVFVCGGETSTPTTSDISSGEVFDPASNAWTQMAVTNTSPAYIQGDVPASVLAGGRVVMGAITDIRWPSPVTRYLRGVALDPLVSRQRGGSNLARISRIFLPD